MNYNQQPQQRPQQQQRPANTNQVLDNLRTNIRNQSLKGSKR